MSSHQPFNTVPPIGEVSLAAKMSKSHVEISRHRFTYFNNFEKTFQVQHIHFLSEHIGALFLNDEYSDVTLVVESNRFNAHKVILAARSEYFR